MTATTAPTKGPDTTPPTPAGIPLWPVTLIGGEVFTILGSVGWAAAGPVGVLVGIGGLTAACAAAAAGTRYRRASTARRRAANAADVGLPGGAGGRRRSSGLPGLSPGRGLRSALGRPGSSKGAAGGTRSGKAGGLGRGTGRSGAAGTGKKPSRLAGLLGRRRPGAGAGSGGKGGAPAGRGAGAGRRSSGVPKLGLFRKLKPAGASKGAAGKASIPKDPTATGSKRRPFWRGLTPKAIAAKRAAGHSSRVPWQLFPKAGSRRKPNKAAPPLGTGPKTGNTIRGTGPSLIKTPAPVPKPGPAPKTPNTPSIPATIAASRGTRITGGTMRSRLGFNDLTQQCVANAARWNVGTGEMTPAANELASELEALLNGAARSIEILAAKLQTEQPLHPALHGITQSGAQSVRRVASCIAQFGPAFEKLHAAEIQRQTSPRPNEDAWNPTHRRT